MKQRVLKFWVGHAYHSYEELENGCLSKEIEHTSLTSQHLCCSYVRWRTVPPQKCWYFAHCSKYQDAFWEMCTVLLFLSSEDQQQGRMEVYGSSCWGSRFSYGVHPNRDSIHKEINHYSVPARIIGSLNNHNEDDNNNIKNNCFYEQNSLGCASRILVHFFDVHCTTTMWNHLVWCFMKDAMNIRQQSFLSLLDSTPGEIAYIWQILIKFERTQIHL